MGRRTLTWIHNHECAFKGEEYVDTTYTRNGAYVRPTPVCDETQIELLLVGDGERRDHADA